MIKVIVNGYHGKMGSIICSLLNEDSRFEIVAGVDPFSPNYSEPFPSFEKIEDCDIFSDVIIDFSTAKAVGDLARYAVDKKTPVVICTTGLSKTDIENIKIASSTIPVFKSANMSLGINLISSILKQISNVLYDANFDIEIVEKHHNQKLDAPSGTAYLLAESIKSSVGDIGYAFDRSAKRGKRPKGEIGFHAIRGGTIVGEHNIIFAGTDEVIEIKHTAYSRALLARGAVKAAGFIYDKPPGLYDMQDLLKGLLG
ncbi:MAG: 4-hydroxy-tetrahydrodipicolinate reductase [Clostridiales bacterium]|nr:4-hydroxy-tetrahydrodipicolinate reductase [Clostridiales bacterium]